MARFAALLLPLYLVGALTYCGSSSDNNGGAGASATGPDSQAAQQGVAAADDGSSSDGLGAGRTATMMALQMATRALDNNSLLNGNGTLAFKFGGCTAELDYDLATSDTNVTISATETFSDSNCTGKLKLAGSQNVTIVTDRTGSNRMTTVTGALTRTLGTGDQIAITTLDSTVGWGYKLVANGLPASGDVNVLVSLNEHRVRTSADASVAFDHNITTPSDGNGVLVVAAYNGSVAQSHTISAGEIDVHHNIAKFTAKHTFDKLFHDVSTSSTCTCPSSGSLTQVVTADANDWTYTRVYAFTGCGQANVTTSASTKSDTANGTGTVTWDNCTN